jgi:hypothetical protein
MPNRKILPILIIFITLLIIGYFFTTPAFNYLSDYLSKNEQVNANILIVEGWLPENAIEESFKEFRKNKYEYIITTGLKPSGDYYKLSDNGYLIFYPKDRFISFTQSIRHSIEISAVSQLGGVNCAHFNVFINDSIVSDFYANKKKKKFLTTWVGKLAKIDSLMVQFDNDKVGEFGDRNLYVKEVIIDHKITIPYLYNSEYDIIKPEGKRRIINNYNTYAQLARNRLLSFCIDSSSIKAVPSKQVKINRTLTSALAVRDWLKQSDIRVEGINIVSAGTHSRRTWMTYNKVLNESYKIGIISLPDYNIIYSHWRRFFKTLRETGAIIYYWIILLPY